ncbi:hypothetical protein [Rothia terrae]|uniref:Uncharacterized protein n=1 Tax=Rothia terrae TaxID=396015 RepID=A0A7H2BDM8_9MICC|nr:hypothetical protein [Rothia terrae]QNV37774.1 hypothetical protein IDM49_00170 [Rothia terrae]
MNLAEIFEKIVPVLLAGLFFGAGLPALYALGMRLMAGTTEYTADGRLVEIEGPSGLAKVLGYLIFAIIVAVIIIGILWIAKDFLLHTTGFDLFGLAGK